MRTDRTLDRVTGPASGPAFTVLLVCTGNICRSALAERLGRAYLDERVGGSSTAVRLTSGGSRAVVGSAMHPDSALVLAGYGAEPGDFRARQLEEAHVREADLVLTMTRAHRDDVLARSPRALARTFTLREAADLLERADVAEPQQSDPRDRGLALVQALAAGRAHRSSGRDDDVPDPIGKPVEAHAEAGELIAAALLPLLDRLASPAAESSAADAQRGTSGSD